MDVNRSKFLAIAFVVVFLLIFMIALLSRISLRVSFSRSVLAAVVFSAMLWLVMLIVRYAVPEETDRSPDYLGQNINIKVTDESAENHQDPAAEKNSPDFSEPEFIPLAGRQVDPNMAKVINQDPEKLAKIIEKMGINQ